MARSWSRRTADSRSTPCCSEFIPPRAASKSWPIETPALLIVFDLLVNARGERLTQLPLQERREALERFLRTSARGAKHLRLSPATTAARRRQRLAQARRQRARRRRSPSGATFDYLSGERSGMQKIKNYRSADCVVGGFRYNEGKRVVGSLLLGLYDDAGLLHHVGFTSTIARKDKPALTKKLEKFIAPPGLHRQCAGRTEPLVDRADRRSGIRSSRSSWSRSATTISAASASGTARGSCAGGRTRRRDNARSISCSRRRRT